MVRLNVGSVYAFNRSGILYILSMLITFHYRGLLSLDQVKKLNLVG